MTDESADIADTEPAQSATSEVADSVAPEFAIPADSDVIDGDASDEGKEFSE